MTMKLELSYVREDSVLPDEACVRTADNKQQ